MKYEKLRAEKLRRWKYRTHTEEVHDSVLVGNSVISTLQGRIDEDGLITIYAGYCWDGGSGPAIDTKNSQVGSLFHDFLYQLMREGLLGKENKDVADKLLQQICLEYGMWSWRAGWWYWAVKHFAKRSLIPDKKPLIFEIPKPSIQ